MRNRWHYFRPLVDYLAVLVGVFGLLMLAPLAVCLLFRDGPREEVGLQTWWIPAVASLVLAVALKRDLRFRPLDNRRAMILCALGWIVVSAIGAAPLVLGRAATFPGMSPLDAYFETVSGFTTTGITMLTGLDAMPRSILFWRSFTQWLGGLGILTFFLAILYVGRSAHWLYSAESHKVFARRPAPGLFHTLRILWTIYTAFTVATTVALALEGTGWFDAACHAMTALSTGGYSPHDASIGYYRDAGFAHATLIEYTVVVAMLLGGINFFVHFRWLRGGVRALWDSLEMRLWWLLVFGATGLVMLSHLRHWTGDALSLAGLHETFRVSAFQVVSIITTTGFATRDIIAPWFPPATRLVFLCLMVIGGCVGSTGGGIKVLRIGLLLAMARRQVRRLLYGSEAVQPVVVDGEVIPVEELRRVAALFFGWIALLAFGALVTALLSRHDALASASGMFSALGNIGPCYIPAGPPNQMALLHPAVKVVYILGMLAGRLEILPLMLLFSRRTWR